MANNLFANIPAACVAKSSISFVSAGLDVTNINIIFEVGSPLKSWKPERSINSVTGFTSDKGYYIVPKVNMDLTALLIPPIAGGGGGDTTPPTVTSATVQDATHIRLVFSEVVTGTASGHSFKKNGSNLGISLMTGSGTNTLDFTVGTAIVAGDVILRSYSSISGDTADTATSPNELVTYTDQVVTNGLSGGGTNRRAYSGYLSRWEVPADPSDTSKIFVRTAGANKFLSRLKDDKHAITTTWDLRQIDDDTLQPKHVVSGISGRPALEFQVTQRAFATFPGGSGLGFPCEIGCIMMLPAWPTATAYFSMCNSGALDAAVTPSGELWLYVNPEGDFFHTGVILDITNPTHIVRRREANGDTKAWINNIATSLKPAYGTSTILTTLGMGGDGSLSGAGAGFHFFMAELWASGSDSGGTPVLPTDSERTSLYNDAKTDFPTLP